MVNKFLYEIHSISIFNFLLSITVYAYCRYVLHIQITSHDCCEVIVYMIKYVNNLKIDYIEITKLLSASKKHVLIKFK